MRTLLRSALIALLVLTVPVVAVAQGAGPIVRSANMQTAAVANGNGTLLDTSQASVAVLQLTCTVTCSGGTTVNFEATQDATNFTALFCLPLIGTIPTTNVAGASSSAPTSTSLMFRCNVAGINAIRARISAYSAGTLTVIGTSTSIQNGGSYLYM